MNFEQALINFLANLQEEYGNKQLIKSIELSDDLYKRVEFELLGKALRLPIDKAVKSSRMQFYCCNHTIELNKATDQNIDKPKRTIAEYHRMDDSFFVISNDRKMFHWQGNRMGWYALPDLPQD